MNINEKHVNRETLAALTRGVSLEEQLKLKRTAKHQRDDIDSFAAWTERFRHELSSEFGPIPDDEDSDGLILYIRNMKRKFRLNLK